MQCVVPLHYMIQALDPLRINKNTRCLYATYFIFGIFYYVLNISVHVFPDDGGWPPKHVGENNKLFHHVYFDLKMLVEKESRSVLLHRMNNIKIKDLNLL
jgi:hypothetical protein